jgi:hypothetical protein
MSDETPLPKQELLIKLMNMTSSSNDGEALSAVRKANELLLANKWSWEKLVHSKIKVIADPFVNTPKVEPGRPVNGRMSTPDQPVPRDNQRYQNFSPAPPPRPQPAAPPRPTIFPSPKRSPIAKAKAKNLASQAMPPVSPSPKTEFFSAKPKRPSNSGPQIGDL